jgi:16S rRNA processing protein RimM
MKVYSFTDPREAVLEHRQWLLDRNGHWQAFEIAEGKRHGKGVIARLQGVDDRDDAATYVGSDIGVPRDALPDARPGEYYWADLEGLRVVHRDGKELGEVAYLIETGANDVLVTKGDQERLIPFIMDEVILDVDLDDGVISVDWEWD